MSNYNEKFFQDSFNEINYYKNLMTLMRNEDVVFYFRNNLEKICNDLYNVIELTKIEGRHEFTLEELSKYDGKNGKPAYVAVDGIVYDVTSEKLWVNGIHLEVSAGKDLTSQYKNCHKNNNILEKLKIVGMLRK
jgi:predicted heme/steroid binding protein